MKIDRGLGRGLKRCLDVLVAVPMLVLCAIPLALAALWIKAEDRAKWHLRCGWPGLRRSWLLIGPRHRGRRQLANERLTAGYCEGVCSACAG